MVGEMKRLCVGDWVEVRSRAEILATLDEKGQLDGMPFMPEMFQFCGQRFQVHKRAHKTCDTVYPVRSRHVEGAVHLRTRCDGSAHGGCQAGCLIFWKEAWLRPVTGGGADPKGSCALVKVDEGKNEGSNQSVVWRNCQVPTEAGKDSIRYVCQATQVPYFTTRTLAWWDPRQYLEDYLSGNVSLWRMICGLTYSVVYHLSQAGVGLGRPVRWFYDKFHFLWRGTPFPRHVGSIPENQPTPSGRLDLKPGEWVRVKSHQEILRTLNTASRNRGLLWDAEMVPFCGGTYRVQRTVTEIIDEKTGLMLSMKSPCIILEAVVCEGRYSYCRMFCPREIYPYFREIWLERIKPSERRG